MLNLKQVIGQSLDLQRQAVQIIDASVTPMMGPLAERFHDALERHGLAAASPFWMFLSREHH